MKIKKNDTIKIMAGKDKNKTGKVLKILPKNDKVLIEGLNLFKKHVKPKNEGEKGQTISVARPVDISNVMMVCSSCHQPTRVGFRIDNKNKSRYCKKCKSVI